MVRWAKFVDKASNEYCVIESRDPRSATAEGNRSQKRQARIAVRYQLRTGEPAIYVDEDRVTLVDETRLLRSSEWFDETDGAKFAGLYSDGRRRP